MRVGNRRLVRAGVERLQLMRVFVRRHPSYLGGGI
jgi:hypothetical protein